MAGYVKLIQWFGDPAAVACDGKCDKAWGISNRPKVEFSGDPDDFAFLADGEVGTAPDDPGTYEGGHAKPCGAAKLNKWCVRECERSALFGHLETEQPHVILPDFTNRVYNQPWKHTRPTDQA